MAEYNIQFPHPLSRDKVNKIFKAARIYQKTGLEYSFEDTIITIKWHLIGNKVDRFAILNYKKNSRLEAQLERRFSFCTLNQ